MIAAVVLFITSCAATPVGPLTIGSGGDKPTVVTCVGMLGSRGTFLAGDFLRNDTQATFVVTSAVANGAEGLTVKPLAGRHLADGDEHFLIVSEEESTEPAFTEAAATTDSFEGMEIAPGEEIGIVLTATLKEDFGTIRSLTVTYQGGGETYQNTSTTSFQGAAGTCPD